MSESKKDIITYYDIVNSANENEQFQTQVCKKKYQHDNENSYRDVQRRIVTKTNELLDKYDYSKLLSNQRIVSELIGYGRFIPAGSILFGLGNSADCSLSNCYVNPIQRDSIDNRYGYGSGIGDSLTQMMRIFSFRGGVGTDLSVLRPADAKVNNTSKISSGAVSFAPLLSRVTESTCQNGRRGALMLTIDVRHPDFLNFIKCKTNPEEVFGKNHITGAVMDVFNANLSCKLTTEFMNAVEKDGDWTFIFPDFTRNKTLYDMKWSGDYEEWESCGGTFSEYSTVKARDIMYEIAKYAHISGDPGVMFIDTAIKNTPSALLHPRLKPITSNPCGEQIMAAYANCLLGAIVLHKYVEDPFTKEAKFNQDLFLTDICDIVIIMNAYSKYNANKHPLNEQCEMDMFSRRIGIEFTGLGDMFAMLGMKYGSEESIEFIEKLLMMKAVLEIEASSVIAANFGPCEVLQSKEARKKFIMHDYFKKIFNACEKLSPAWKKNVSEIKANVLKYGLANTAFNTVGPTGSISILSDNCTSGMEPLFAISYSRKTMLDNTKSFRMIHYPLVKYLMENKREDIDNDKITIQYLKDNFNYVEAHEVDYDCRLNMQSVIQKYTDSSISSTINLPNDCTVDKIMDIYIKAWKKGLKGITVFRDGCKQGILSIDNNSVSTKKDEHDGINNTGNTSNRVINVNYNDIIMPMELDDIMPSKRHKIPFNGKKMYVTVTHAEGHPEIPLEIFPSPRREIAMVNGVFDEKIFQNIMSSWTAITRLISLLLRVKVPVEYIIDQLSKSSFNITDQYSVLIRVLTEYLPATGVKDMSVEEITSSNLGSECPSCKEPAYVKEGGCSICKSCGYSTCG